MNLIVVIVFCIIHIAGMNGASLKQSVAIKSDAKELTKLLAKIWSLKPSIWKRMDPIVACELIDKCCKGGNHAKATEFMSQETTILNNDLSERIMEICVNSSAANKIDRTCSAVIKSRIPHEETEENPAGEEYWDIITAYNEEIMMLPRWVSRSCEMRHVQAFFCSSNTKLVEECARNVLQMAFDDDYIDYGELITKIKQVFSKIIEKLLKKSSENIDQE